MRTRDNNLSKTRSEHPSTHRDLEKYNSSKTKDTWNGTSRFHCITDLHASGMNFHILPCCQLILAEQAARQSYERQVREDAEKRWESMRKVHDDEVGALREALKVCDALSNTLCLHEALYFI